MALTKMCLCCAELMLSDDFYRVGSAKCKACCNRRRAELLTLKRSRQEKRERQRRLLKLLVTELESELSEANSDEERATSTSKRLRKDNKRLQAENDQLKAEKARLSQEVAFVENKKNVLLGYCGVINRANKEKKQELDEANARITHLEEQLEQLRSSAAPTLMPTESSSTSSA